MRLFSVICRTAVGGGVLPLCRGAISVFYCPTLKINPKSAIVLIKSILCLHPVNVLSLWCFYRESLLLLRFLFGRPYAGRICSIFPLWMEPKVLVKSTNRNVACRFFARMPSRILRMVNICEVVDLFLRKPFLFFLRMLSNLGSMRFCCRAL